jgi:hypothetical protein
MSEWFPSMTSSTRYHAYATAAEASPMMLTIIKTTEEQANYQAN